MSAESFDPPSLEDLAALLPGYELIAFIAQGGMGAVYQARQRSLDRDVAIKILPREFGADPEFRQSFETEAKAMARLNHPNLIGVYDFGDADGMPYIVMEYVPGKSLFHSAHNLAVEPRQAVIIVKAICDGLAHAHENGVIHRDIKPANILLTPKAEPKVGDFGLARPAGEGSTGLLMGTPGYSAPEIMREPDHADHRSDIFALGVVLYELLIGKCPPYDVPPPPPSTIVGCDKNLDVICAIAMHPAASMRYSSAEAMSAALDQWLRGGSRVPAQTIGSVPYAQAAPARAPGSVETVVVEKRSGGSSFMMQAAVLAVLIVITAVAWKHLKGLEAEKEAEQAAYRAKANQADSSESKPAKPNPEPEPDEPAKPKWVPDPKVADADKTSPAKPEPDDAAPTTPPDTVKGTEPDIASGNNMPDKGSSILNLEDEIKPGDIERPKVDLPPAIVELEAKAKVLLDKYEKARDKELAENAKTFTWELDSWHKTLSKGDQLAWKPHVERLKRLATNTRVPDKVDTGSGINMSERMGRIAEFGARKQKAIDAGFESDASKLRDSYVIRVKDVAAKAREAKDHVVADALDARVADSVELSAWLRIIHPDESVAFVLEQTGVADAPASSSLKVVSAIYGSGGKDADVTEKVREWLTVKKTAFRVTPPDLGADPNPGWNKGLTITYIIDGAEAKKSWGENSQISPTDLVSDSSSQSALPKNDDPLIGSWDWFNGHVVEIRADGTLENITNKWTATWRHTGMKNGLRLYEMTWQSGEYVDKISLSDDTISGSNQTGGKISGTRKK